MYTIEKDIINEIIIKKSIFICKLSKVNSTNDVLKTIDSYKKQYKNATHYCYGYIVGNNEKYSDDKEPNGTAGIVILNNLKRKKLNNVLCVVIRYYGGVKLGVGGLTRAYNKGVTNALKEANIIEKKEYLNIEITFNIENKNIIDHILKNEIILNKTYTEVVTYSIKIEVKNYKNLKSKLNKLCKIKEELL